tara:strand:+ start:255 stop:563 length:309 start_codon:yes stop_codon:yes gene_type:complete
MIKVIDIDIDGFKLKELTFCREKQVKYIFNENSQILRRELKKDVELWGQLYGNNINHLDFFIKDKDVHYTIKKYRGNKVTPKFNFANMLLRMKLDFQIIYGL